MQIKNLTNRGLQKLLSSIQRNISLMKRMDITGNKLLDDDKELTDKVVDTNKDPYVTMLIIMKSKISILKHFIKVIRLFTSMVGYN